MSVIRILPPELAGRIAAGEVIERPASVVKELVENSIDAGATRIRVLVEQGGQRLIQVTDNGCGMDREDAQMCFQAHATSKLTRDGDVGQIATLGFRGEAMPSIASVSQLQLQTRRRDTDVGTEVLIDNGVMREVQDCGCAPGTMIRVQHLFGNLPARRKFLRGAATEEGHVEEMLLMLALSRPDIAFSLSFGGREVLRASATNSLPARVMALLGRETFESMLPVEYAEEGIAVHGFISRPGYTRSSRREQRMFINGRAAAAETLYFAIRDAYDTLVLKGRYPQVVLYVELAPERVDVNVHPAKREVRFREPRLVGSVVAAALRQALRRMPGTVEPGGLPETLPEAMAARPMPQTPVQPELKLSLPANEAELPPPLTPQSPQASRPDVPPVPPVPAVPPEPPVSPVPPVPPVPAVPPPPVPEVPPPPPVPEVPPVVAMPLPSEEGLGVPGGGLGAGESVARAVPSAAPLPIPSGAVSGVERVSRLSLSPRGRLGKGYLLAETPQGLAVVDIRAAHRRVLFERLLRNLRQRTVQRQQLLLPLTVTLSTLDARALSQQLAQFGALGFTIEPFGGTSFLVSALPLGFPAEHLVQTFQDVVEELRQQRRVVRTENALHLAQLACRHAVTERDEVSEQALSGLLEELSRAEMPYTDPLGRPTMLHFTFSELSRRFRG